MGSKESEISMDKRYSANPAHFRRMTTEETRREFLIETLFRPGEVNFTYSHVDRMVVLGAQPMGGPLPLERGMDVWASFGVNSFLDRRELGVFNVGGPGAAFADGIEYPMGPRDCLYLPMGAKDVSLASEGAENPAKFYMVSAPAHARYAAKLIRIADAAKRPLGSAEACNKRVINQFIHPSVLKTCQLSMGLTELAPGCVWNTMPPHTHERRMEVYFYFGLPDGQAVFHMMGEPDETRHIVVKNEQAVISPSWSIHAGAGTCAYSFIWAMGGENQAFDDMDNLAVGDLR